MLFTAAGNALTADRQQILVRDAAVFHFFKATVREYGDTARLKLVMSNLTTEYIMLYNKYIDSFYSINTVIQNSLMSVFVSA